MFRFEIPEGVFIVAGNDRCEKGICTLSQITSANCTLYQNGRSTMSIYNGGRYQSMMLLCDTEKCTGQLLDIFSQIKKMNLQS